MTYEHSESQARRAAKRVGLMARKSRWRKGSIDNFGEFMIIEPRGNYVLAGARIRLHSRRCRRVLRGVQVMIDKTDMPATFKNPEVNGAKHGWRISPRQFRHMHAEGEGKVSFLLWPPSTARLPGEMPRQQYTPSEYYNLQKNWRKVKRHIEHPEVQALLVRDFNKFTYGRWGKNSARHGADQFESLRLVVRHRGAMPALLEYAKHAACHWLVIGRCGLHNLSSPSANGGSLRPANTPQFGMASDCYSISIFRPWASLRKSVSRLPIRKS